MLRAEHDNCYEGDYAQLMKCSISLSIYFSLEKYQTPSYRHAFCKTIGIPFGYSLLLSSAVTMR